MQEASKNYNLQFGLKLTNTLESVNHKSVFPAKEEMMYMSGRALHPISVHLAKKLQEDFNVELDISFSSGVNAFNIDKVISCGLIPATVCTDILKPGGYGLLKQYLVNLENRFQIIQANSIDDYICKVGKKESKAEAIIENLNDYSKDVLKDKSYQKTDFLEPDIKTERQLGHFDCIHAPCIDTCPTNQDIPDYMYYTANGDFQNAFEVIMRTNPFPNTTGMICDHMCQTKCTRINYENPLLIREIKRFVSEPGNDQFSPKPVKKNRIKVAIIGAGPSGLSCAWFLVLAGFHVDVYETKDKPGGMVSAAIPSFRLTDEAFQKDIERIEELGVKIHYDYKISKDAFDKIRSEVQFIYIAVGAQSSRKFNIEGIKTEGVLDPLDFLFAIKNNKKVKIGHNVAIIGGGNTAMDAARTAYRMVGKNGNVTIMYRRTKKEMPADKGEIKAVLDEGINIVELTLPVKVNSKNDQVHSLTCVKMKLEKSDSNGRPEPVEVSNSEFTMEFDTVIPAIGQDMESNFTNPKFLESKPGIYETKIPNVYIGGDALRGASTAINAIGDGRKAAEKILEKANITLETKLSFKHKKFGYKELMIKRMIKKPQTSVKEIPFNNRKNFKLVTSTLDEEQAKQEASRCLMCDEICNTCVTVCPNLALYSYQFDPVNFQLQKIIQRNGKYEITEDGTFSIKQSPQILHIADWCNECGNCTTFCPTSGSPYRDKPHFYLNRETFELDDDCYFLDHDKKTPKLLYRKDGNLIQLKELLSEFIFTFGQSEIILSGKDFTITQFKINGTTAEINLRKAVEMKVIMEGAQTILLNINLKIETNSNSKDSSNFPFEKGAREIQKTPYLPYNKNLIKYSRNLRNDSTLGEVLLWKELRAKKLGYTFNRQKPILNYIVDFYCKPLNLVIEVDGSSHDNDDAIERDTKRQHDLEAIGLNFLRFDDREVKKDIDNVIREIKAKIKELEKGDSK